jgi:hypothetical protein
MFSSTGLFKKIACPQGSSCAYLNCIFSHVQTDDSPKNNSLLAESPYDLPAAPQPEEPPLKRRRLSDEESEAGVENLVLLFNLLLPRFHQTKGILAVIWSVRGK